VVRKILGKPRDNASEKIMTGKKSVPNVVDDSKVPIPNRGLLRKRGYAKKTN